MGDDMILVAPAGNVHTGDICSPDMRASSDGSVGSSIESPEHNSPKTSGRRKRVTFDLDLQVHTIPNRIPLYERKPASSRSQPLTFAPRHVELKAKERTKPKSGNQGKIIDLFSTTNGFPAYSVPSKGSKQTRKTVELATFTAPLREPYSFSTARQQIKLSKAAASLRDITAELRYQFEQSYQPFLRDKPTRGTSASSTKSNGSVTHGTNKQQPVFNAVAAFSSTRPRSNFGQKNRSLLENQLSARLKSGGPPTGNTTPPGHALRRLSSSGGRESGKNVRSPRQPLGVAARKDYKPRVTIDMNTVAVHFNSPQKSMTQGKRDKPSSARSDCTHERPLSRCSTIDTYVIADDSSGGKRQNSARTTRRRSTDSPTRRSIAWGQQEDDNISVNTTNMNSYQTKEVPYRLAQWRVSARPANLTTS